MYWKTNDQTDVAAYSIHEGDGEIKTRGLFGDVTKLPVRVQVWELAPGVSEGNHTHGDKHPLEEIYYFLEGEGTMWVDGEDVAIAAGDAIMVPPGSDHGFRNTGDGPLKLIIVWGRPKD